MSASFLGWASCRRNRTELSVLRGGIAIERGAIAWIGLRFATAHGIVQKSAGPITVESEVPCGSAFRIDLPDCFEEA
jgi:signal transduction histidine kinase